MLLSIFIKNLWLAACTTAVALTNMAYAQTPTSATPAAPEVTAPYPSAFKGYNPYTEERITNWKAANDTTASIGGWREYARQVQQAENTVTPATKAGETMPKPITKSKP